MNVGELQELIRDLEDDVEVRIAHQPQWAFEYSVGPAAATDPTEHFEVVRDTREDDDAESWWVIDSSEDAGDDEYWVAGPFDSISEANINLERICEKHVAVFYIAEGEQLGYLPGEARKAIGW